MGARFRRSKLWRKFRMPLRFLCIGCSRRTRDKAKLFSQLGIQRGRKAGDAAERMGSGDSQRYETTLGGCATKTRRCWYSLQRRWPVVCRRGMPVNVGKEPGIEASRRVRELEVANHEYDSRTSVHSGAG